MAERKVLRVTRLRENAGVIELDGVEHDVLQMNLGHHQALETCAPDESMTVIRQIVQEVVPTLTAEQVKALTIPMARAINELAGAGIEEVERLYPNAVSPEKTTSPG